MKGTFEAKDATASAHAGITQATAYYPYDPTLGQYQYDRYVVFYMNVVFTTSHLQTSVWSPSTHSKELAKTAEIEVPLNFQQAVALRLGRALAR